MVTGASLSLHTKHYTESKILSLLPLELAYCLGNAQNLFIFLMVLFNIILDGGFALLTKISETTPP